MTSHIQSCLGHGDIYTMQNVDYVVVVHFRMVHISASSHMEVKNDLVSAQSINKLHFERSDINASFHNKYPGDSGSFTDVFMGNQGNSS